MPKRKISQFQTIEAENVSSADLYVVARKEVDNFSLTGEQQIDKYKDFSEIFPIDLTPRYINNIGTTVGSNNISISEIDNLTFNKFGMVVSYTEKTTPVSRRVVDCYSGSIDLRGISDTVGYFYNKKSLQGTSNKFSNSPNVRYVSTSTSTSQTGDWSLLFDKEYNFKKSIISYTHSRLDESGSVESISSFKFYIYWNGENSTQVNGSGMISIGVNNEKSASLIYPFKTLRDNVSYSPIGGYSDIVQTINKAVISIDGKNKKIDKLPITPFVPSTRTATHSIYLTVESFA